MDYQLLKFGNTGVKVNNNFLSTECFCTLTIITDEHAHVTKNSYYVRKGTSIKLYPTFDSYYRLKKYDAINCTVNDNKVTVNKDCSVNIISEDNIVTISGIFKSLVGKEYNTSSSASYDVIRNWIQIVPEVTSISHGIMNYYTRTATGYEDNKIITTKAFFPGACKNVNFNGTMTVIAEKFETSGYVQLATVSQQLDTKYRSGLNGYSQYFAHYGSTTFNVSGTLKDSYGELSRDSSDINKFQWVGYYPKSGTGPYGYYNRWVSATGSWTATCLAP